MAAYTSCRYSFNSLRNIGVYNKILKPKRGLIKANAFHRTFLSASYFCNEAWAKRLEEPLIKNIDTENYYFELDRKFASTKKISAIDLDLYVHSIVNADTLEELDIILWRFRNTPNSVQVLPSTLHAVVRLYLQFGKYDVLLKILRDKNNYGIFPSFYCFNLMMDTFLNQQNNRDAVRIATEVMLQEDFSNELTTHLAFYSCLAYLKNPLPEPWVYVPPPPEEELEENVVIRLNYLPPNYFDDHFDLTDPKKLVGKTLVKLGNLFPDRIGRTCQAIGYAMYEKWEKLHRCLETFAQDAVGKNIYREGVERIRTEIQAIPDDEKNTRQDWESKLNPLLDSLSLHALEESLLDAERVVVSAVAKQQEAIELAAQLKLYESFAVTRRNEVERQVQEFIRSSRIKKLQEMKEDLERREQLLFFFENFEKHAMKVQVFDTMAEEIAKKETKKEDLDYVPPEVVKRHPVPAK